MLRFKPLAKSVFRALTAPMPARMRYRCQAAAERVIFALTPKVHELPPIFHYWSNRYLRPQMQGLGFSDPDDFFIQTSAQVLGASTDAKQTLLSIGCGRAELELAIAQNLIKNGLHDFQILGLDISAEVIESAQQRFQDAGLGERFRGVVVDINDWRPEPGQYFDLVIANHSLHHLLALEAIFDRVKAALKPDGRFLVCDMIGKNGHALWPELLHEVEQFWQELPAKKRFDRASGRIEARYYNYDASKVGFEGIRAQDILPLLVQRFHFELFLPYGGLAVAFLERRIGGNFDPAEPADLAFVDRLAEREAALFAEQKVKPTQMIAVLSLCADRPTRLLSEAMSPLACMRATDA